MSLTTETLRKDTAGFVRFFVRAMVLLRFYCKGLAAISGSSVSGSATRVIFSNSSRMKDDQSEEKVFGILTTRSFRDCVPQNVEVKEIAVVT